MRTTEQRREEFEQHLDRIAWAIGETAKVVFVVVVLIGIALWMF